VSVQLIGATSVYPETQAGEQLSPENMPMQDELSATSSMYGTEFSKQIFLVVVLDDVVLESDQVLESDVELIVDVWVAVVYIHNSTTG